MLICHDPKIIFVHIQRTGGTSIRRFLSKHLSKSKDIEGTHDFVGVAKKHIEDKEEKWGDYYSFSFVRNPWDRLVSWYYFIIQQNSWLKLHHYVKENGPDFTSFIIRCTEVIHDMDGDKCCAWNQLDYLTDIKGDIIVDFIGRFEYLQRDFEIVRTRLSISETDLSHINKTDHKGYRQYYTDETRQIVEDRFRKDIEYFGYTF